MPNSLVERLLGEAGRQIDIRDDAGASLLVNQVLGIDPKNARGLAFAAVLANRAGQKDRALDLAEVALKLGPDAPIVIYNAASVFFRCRQPHRARALWERLTELLPCSAEIFWNLATYHFTQNDVSAAEVYYRKVMELNPNLTGLHAKLGSVLFLSGRVEEATSLYREGARMHPEDMRQASNYLPVLNYDPTYGPEQIYAECAAWGRTFESTIASQASHANDRSPARQLRVGYIAPFFCYHPARFFLLPLFRKHDHSQFEIHCYSDTRPTDEMTGWFRQHADVWHDTAGITDTDLADRIARNQIDVLVDLVMHLEG
jgi:protein O-GlcNAc transferase